MKTLILLLLIPILISGQTVTEKIKAKFKQINDAKIERLKECEEANTTYATYVRIDTITARYTWTESFVNMWDEYAKECSNDTLIIPTRDLMWTKPSGYKAVGLRFIGDDANYIYVRQPDPIEFITVFLRNKLGEIR